VKTRQQRQIVVEGIAPKYHGVVQSCILISKEEGMLALWKGIGPRLARIMPGQAITFATYESISKKLRQFL
jgi:solute carrier family 25 citrate transporter 1